MEWLTAFVLIAPVELPDKTFVATLVHEHPLPAAAGLAGRWLLRHLRLSLVRYVAGGVCGVLAALTAVTVFRG